MKSLFVKTESHFPLEKIVIKTMNIKHRPSISRIRQAADKRGYRPPLIIIAQRDCRSLKPLTQYIFLVKSVHTRAFFCSSDRTIYPMLPVSLPSKLSINFHTSITFTYIFNISRHPVISNLTYSATICSIS